MRRTRPSGRFFVLSADMLQVGCAHGPGGARDPGLSPQETRTHFGAWSIVSSPLTLSHDVNDDAISEEIWSVIANKVRTIPG